ncbi:MAG: hypothetical protein SFY95_07940 [Planctomycetota bacterium]|nr:hypothetical protein [Planctomycetota bacterium]
MARPPRHLRTHALLIALSLALGAVAACAIAYLGVIRARWLEERAVVLDMPHPSLIPEPMWVSTTTLNTSPVWPGMTLAQTSLFAADRFNKRISESLLQREELEGRRAFPSWLARELMPWDFSERWDSVERFRSIVAAGWPFLYLRGELPNSGPVREINLQRGVWIIDDELRMPRSAAIHSRPMPLHPLPARFAAASALYALPFLALMHAIRWALLARRRRRGLCTACGYPRQGLAPDAPCPECGTLPVAPPARSTHEPAITP